MLKEFRAFIMRGNVIDLAVGIIIGAAFTAIVNSLVGDIIMPVISLVTGKIDFLNLYIPLAGQPGGDIVAAKKLGAVIAYGSFLTAAINFIIIAVVVFLLIRTINTMVRKPAPPDPTPPPPTKEEQLLTEIRDLLKSQQR
jgi:large conductance mechanosensitive channel